MRLETPGFSVIVRCFNRRDRVVRAVDSILCQTDQDFEIIVVDDASTDGSVAQLDAAYGDHPNVRLIRHTANQGAAAAANTGVAEARGAYIAFLDSDDTFLPGCLAAHRAALEAAPNVMMTYCDYVQLWEPYGFERILSCGTDDQDQRLATLKGGFIHSQSLIVLRREVFESVGAFDTSLLISHDFDLWMRLALSFDQPFKHVTEPLVRYTLSPDGVTKRYDRWWQEAKTVVARGKSHPNARPYLYDLDGVETHLGANILARQAVEHWVRRRRDQAVSVIIQTPVRADDLESSMSSLWEQTYKDIELVFVCTPAERDASDVWGALARERGIPTVSLCADLPAGDLLGRAMKVAKGPLIAFMEAGYNWHPDYLTEQVRAFSFPTGRPIFSCTGAASDGSAASPLVPQPNDLSAMVIGTEILPYLDLDRDLPDLSAAKLATRCHAVLEAGQNPSVSLGAPIKITRKLVTLPGEAHEPRFGEGNT